MLGGDAQGLLRALVGLLGEVALEGGGLFPVEGLEGPKAGVALEGWIALAMASSDASLCCFASRMKVK